MKSKPKILIVDDKIENLVVLEKILENTNVEFVRAISGKKALKKILKYDFAMAIIDVQMLVMDSFELVENIRQSEKTKLLPIIFGSTIYKEDYYLIKGIESGTVDFMTKPIIPEILAGKVRVFVDLYNHTVERRRMEEQLKQVLSELERSNKDLEQFAYVASHDLQEPLRMVASYTQLLARRYKDKLDADANDFINFAVDGANRMQTLINDLLTFSRVGTRGKPFVATDINLILERICKNLEVSIQESGAVIAYDSLPTLNVDKTQIEQLFQNLISNAIKFRNEKSPDIRVRAEQKEKKWQFSISDNGIGFKPEYKDRIFTIFQRLHGKEEYPGTGIGLAICKKIVERHGGQIRVESEVGKGATFYFTIQDR